MKKVLVVLAVVLCTASYGFAGNVQTFGIGSNATAQGEAVAAYANDPFAVYYNPAGLTLIKKPTFSTGAMVYDATIKVSNFKINSTLTGDHNYNAGASDFETDCDTIINPHMGFAMPINENFTFGIAAYAPFGLHATWGSNPVANPGALYAYETEFYRQTLTPSLGIKVSDTLSFGLGVSLGKSVSNASKTVINPADMSINHLKLESEDSFNVSVNFGVMYQPVDELSFGLTYRGRTDADFKGDVIFNEVTTGDVEMSYDHPESIQGGARYFFSDALSVEFDMTWTRWSILEEQTESFNPPLFGVYPSITHNRDWEDTIQYKLGGEWNATEALALRAGVTYDPTPIPDHTFDFGWPDTDRTAINFGVGYKFNEKWSIDSAFQFVNSTPVREINGTSSELNGTYGELVHQQSLLPGSPMEIPADTVRVSLEDEGILWGLGLTVNYTF